MSLVKIDNLFVSFGNTEAVKNASLEIAPGEMVGLVGESGSGKSVTALSILGLVQGAETTGHIKVEGKEIGHAPEKIMRDIRGDKIGMIFQEPMSSLNPLHTIGRQIAEAVRTHNPEFSKEKVRTRVMELIEDVGLQKLKDRLNAYPHELSGGQRQRVMIAMAIANKPDLLIADEPTTALDVIVARQILDLLKEIQATHNMAILLITHDLTIVEKLCDRVYVMKSGEIVENGETKKLFGSPNHEYTKTLLSSAPKGGAVKASAGPVVVMRAEGVSVSFPKKSGFLDSARKMWK